MPTTGNRWRLAAASESRSPASPKSIPWLFAIDTTSTDPPRRAANALGGVRNTKVLPAAAPPFVTAVSRFATAMSASPSTGAIGCSRRRRGRQPTSTPGPLRSARLRRRRERPDFRCARARVLAPPPALLSRRSARRSDEHGRRRRAMATISVSLRFEARAGGETFGSHATIAAEPFGIGKGRAPQCPTPARRFATWKVLLVRDRLRRRSPVANMCA